MADDGKDARVYGASDEDNRQPAPPQGLRGEQGSPLDDGSGGYARTETLEGGRRVVIEEQSGTAFAEASGSGKPAE